MKDKHIHNTDDLKKFYGKYMDGLFWEIRELVKFEWDYGNKLGTEVHNFLENKAYKDGYFENPFDGKKYKTINIKKYYDNQSVVDDLWDLEDGFYPELVVWCAESGTCGQIDAPFIETIDGIRYVDVFDFKSNKGYDREAGIEKRKELERHKKTYLGKGKGALMCKAPIDSLFDTTYTRYQGQVSMYGRLLERAGFVCRNTAIGHMLEYDPNQMRIIQYPYLADAAEKVLSHAA